MRRCQPVPRNWLMTDERMGDTLWEAIGRLPQGSGVVVRHYALPLAQRYALLARIERIAARRRLVVLGAGLQASGGVHNGCGRGLISWSVHNRREGIAAARAGADLVFASPVFATRSHPGARALGPVRLGLMIRRLPMPVIALGGMSERRFRGVRRIGVHGWAGIDAWTQKRKAVPT